MAITTFPHQYGKTVQALTPGVKLKTVLVPHLTAVVEVLLLQVTTEQLPLCILRSPPQGLM